jgi:hypothetical protein
MIEMKYSGTGFGTKELNAEQKPGLSFLGHFGISPTREYPYPCIQYLKFKILK